jgi:hypothetical protein
MHHVFPLAFHGMPIHRQFNRDLQLAFMEWLEQGAVGLSVLRAIQRDTGFFVLFSFWNGADLLTSCEKMGPARRNRWWSF